MATKARLMCDLTEPAPIPEAGIARAVELMRSGRLFRYGEHGADQSDVSLLEREFAELVGRRYCVAVNSGGGAIFLALKVSGVRPGDPVLVNGFTLAPVPGAIDHAGGRPIVVEIGPDYVIDLADLEVKARASGAKVLLLSHMRGHLADMDQVVRACRDLGLTLIEDCAHALLATWNGRAIGTFGAAAAFSAQTYKHLNSGEGGFLVLDDDERAARAILHSGSYMLHGQHLSAPSAAHLKTAGAVAANYSLRMTALAAALLRPQLAELPHRVARWNEIHERIAVGLAPCQYIRVPTRGGPQRYSATSIQFTVQGLNPAELARVIALAKDRGLPIKWFGAAEAQGFTSQPRHWRFADVEQGLERTHDVLSGLFDIRTPVTLTDADCDLIAEIVRDAIEIVVPAAAGSRHIRAGQSVSSGTLEEETTR